MFVCKPANQWVDRRVRGFCLGVIGLFSILLWQPNSLSGPNSVRGQEVQQESSSTTPEAKEKLAGYIAPWLDCLQLKSPKPFCIEGQLNLTIDRKNQSIDVKLIRVSGEAYRLTLSHSDYAIEIVRDASLTVIALPKHKRLFWGQGTVDDRDHIAAQRLFTRLVSSGTSIASVTSMLAVSTADDLAGTIMGLLPFEHDPANQSWTVDQSSKLRFTSPASNVFQVAFKKETAPESSLQLRPLTSEETNGFEPTDTARPEAISNWLQIHWPSYDMQERDRAEIERTFARGVRRAMEVLAPSPRLTSPKMTNKKVANGELRWVDGQRVVLLAGSPDEIGLAHGQLLTDESMRCIDSVLYAFGTAQTIVTGKWFRDELEKAYIQLEPNIPERHKQETRALAKSLSMEPRLVETLNVFPELFHCSGFALFGSATIDGKLYHGRVLDYMTMIGLQDAATTFIVAPENCIAFANVGYAGFTGSVSGMNMAQISLGEMGGKGEGQWNGVPMATLMRRALEECSTLDQVKSLWRDSPRTCEYFYVFADGKSKSAVGVAATPESIEFIGPGEGHERLGTGIQDAIVLSAGSRLEELRKRVIENHGKIDAQVGQQLMCRPVAMNSNLHNVLFVPEDGVLYVANASHSSPAADRPYVRLDLRELASELHPEKQKPAKPTTQSVTKTEQQLYHAADSWTNQTDSQPDAMNCLSGLAWKPTKFEVTVTADMNSANQNASEKNVVEKKSSFELVRFPSPMDTGNTRNDLVAMEWYRGNSSRREGATSIDKMPAVVVVHESGSGMTVGRLIAKAISKRGVHAFMLQLPHYGFRREGQGRPTDSKTMVLAMKQSVVDVRRAYDAVAAIPEVDANRISLQGTSLGGFVAATTAGLDPSFHSVVVLLAGGNLNDVILHGKKDAAKLREQLIRGGLTEESIRQAVEPVEPMRLAHRVESERVWLYSGELDDVVPIQNARQWAHAARLPVGHHIEMYADHYSGVLFLPKVVEHIVALASE